MPVMSQQSPIVQSYTRFLRSHGKLFSHAERLELKRLYKQYYLHPASRSVHPGNPVLYKLNVTEIILEEVGLGKTAVLAFLLHEMVRDNLIVIEDIERRFRTPVGPVISGLLRVRELYARSASLESENFRKLLLTFAEDVRVILIIIAE